MKPCSKPIAMALSITQIVMSAAFFLLGMIHGFYGERSVTLNRFFPCWIVALVLPVGIMGLALRSHQTLRSSQLLKHAIWSLCVVCIVWSALILYIYTDCVIEIVLAAAMMKICKTTTTTPQLSSSSSGYYQIGECQQPLLVYPVGQQQVHVDVRENQCSQRRLETSI
ncbi:uncharacterized protein LOC141859394 isoform X2 [Acropora palmata]|uniref:uncharacterized protein LOC141859394 isoform X2 n=1 Tax=Acropora palmata TaxID=6131 RepID=UPI003DA1C217